MLVGVEELKTQRDHRSRLSRDCDTTRVARNFSHRLAGNETRPPTIVVPQRGRAIIQRLTPRAAYVCRYGSEYWARGVRRA